ncbi:hypothetical protein P4278_32825 [Bacillus thuringiensis]|nr:hypothetical protein [Bacillus thuringiensis]MED2784371.1 hypothetical protein [Bacillus thuringiensis]
MIKIKNDGVEKVLKDKLFDKNRLKEIALLGGTLKQTYKDAYQSNDYSDTLRTLVLGGCGAPLHPST